MARLNARDIWERNDQAVGDLNAERKQQSANLETDRAADTQNWTGGKIIEGIDARIANQETASWALVQNQGAYVREMVRANRWRAEGLTASEVAGASWAVAGVNSGAAVAKGGVNQGYRLDLQANKITRDGAVKDL